MIYNIYNLFIIYITLFIIGSTLLKIGILIYTYISIIYRHIPGLANCRYVAHQSDTQAQNAPKGYIARQEMTPEIAHIHIGRLQNGMI